MLQQKPNILIVDDHPTNIKLVEGFLRQDGRYNYSSTTQPTEVLELCRDHAVDMVLLDIMMPAMDGYEVCEALKSNPDTKDIPVIFLSAKHEPESIVKGFKAGGVDYLIKPINGMELLVRITTHLSLRRHEQQLQELNATKDRFISIIAEDLRSPITGLRGVLQMIDNNFDTLNKEHLHEYISMSHLAADSLASLAENLIEWSSLHVNELPLHPTQLDLHELFASAIRSTQEEAPQKDIQFHLTIDEGTLITTDEPSLRQVALNLLRNAVAFSHQQGDVTISAEADDLACTISIIDNGIGIDAENQKKLFQLDQRFSRAGTAGEMGSSMGLLLCRELLERNHGTISIQSELNKGTQATITLPRASQ